MLMTHRVDTVKYLATAGDNDTFGTPGECRVAVMSLNKGFEIRSKSSNSASGCPWGLSPRVCGGPDPRKDLLVL